MMKFEEALKRRRKNIKLLLIMLLTVTTGMWATDGGGDMDTSTSTAPGSGTGEGSNTSQAEITESTPQELGEYSIGDHVQYAGVPHNSSVLTSVQNAVNPDAADPSATTSDNAGGYSTSVAADPISVAATSAGTDDAVMGGLKVNDTVRQGLTVDTINTGDSDDPNSGQITFNDPRYRIQLVRDALLRRNVKTKAHIEALKLKINEVTQEINELDLDNNKNRIKELNSQKKILDDLLEKKKDSLRIQVTDINIQDGTVNLSGDSRWFARQVKSWLSGLSGEGRVRARLKIDALNSKVNELVDGLSKNQKFVDREHLIQKLTVVLDVLEAKKNNLNKKWRVSRTLSRFEQAHADQADQGGSIFETEMSKDINAVRVSLLAYDPNVPAAVRQTATLANLRDAQQFLENKLANEKTYDNNKRLEALQKVQKDRVSMLARTDNLVTKTPEELKLLQKQLADVTKTYETNPPEWYAGVDDIANDPDAESYKTAVERLQSEITIRSAKDSFSLKTDIDKTLRDQGFTPSEMVDLAMKIKVLKEMYGAEETSLVRGSNQYVTQVANTESLDDINKALAKNGLMVDSTGDIVDNTEHVRVQQEQQAQWQKALRLEQEAAAQSNKEFQQEQKAQWEAQWLARKEKEAAYKKAQEPLQEAHREFTARQEAEKNRREQQESNVQELRNRLNPGYDDEFYDAQRYPDNERTDDEGSDYEDVEDGSDDDFQDAHEYPVKGAGINALR